MLTVLEPANDPLALLELIEKVTGELLIGLLYASVTKTCSRFENAVATIVDWASPLMIDKNAGEPIFTV